MKLWIFSQQEKVTTFFYASLLKQLFNKCIFVNHENSKLFMFSSVFNQKIDILIRLLIKYTRLSLNYLLKKRKVFKLFQWNLEAFWILNNIDLGEQVSQRAAAEFVESNVQLTFTNFSFVGLLCTSALITEKTIL